MNKLKFSFVILIILNLSISSFLFERSFAQESQIIPPRHQWKQLADPDNLTCNEDLILLQKNNGSPACVSSSTFLKLIDRGYGKFDSSQLMKRSDMMASLMDGMIIDSQVMHHWHTMMISDPKIMQQTMSNLVLQLKENPELMASIIGPMTMNLELREKMIEQMKNHDQMMISFQEHSGWMNSVHQPMMHSNTGKQMSDMHGKDECSWCPEIKQSNLHSHMGFHQPKIMEDMIHHIWVNEKMRTQMHYFMLENPHHLSSMTNQMMEPMLESMMDNPELREKMIEMMLDHQEFMNSIRHENKFSD